MRKFFARTLAIAAFWWVWTDVAIAAAFADEQATPEQIAFFEKKIRPVLVAKCYSCHSANAGKPKGGLTLDTKHGIRRGGDSGPAVVPFDDKDSTLLAAIAYRDENLRMPPKEKLSAEIVADFEKWVKMGAPDPRIATVPVASSEIDIAKGKQFWAFQPPKKTPPPAVKNVSWPRNDVDRFLLAKLESKGLEPVGDAEPAALLRRVFFDLTGLPPTPADIEEFLAAESKDVAYAKIVDQLLANQQFGEHWGRHWLDVVRYGESSGKEVNLLYPNAWRYRDYVVASFNADKPYDRFLREQIAGDLLPAADSNERAANLIATGFLAIGPKSHNERNRLQFQLDVVDEQIDAMSQAFLGMTIACARCHDHKFDPIPTRDYYALAGIFRSTDTCYGTTLMIQNRHPSMSIPLPVDADIPAGRPALASQDRARMESQLDRLERERAAISKADQFGTPKGIRNRVQSQKLQSDLASYEEDGTPKNRAMGVRERLFPRDSELFVRGEVDKPGETVPRGFPQVLCSTQPEIRGGSGRRELADWLAAPSNPLVARVFVNRIWLHLFRRGLVATPDNFGSSGQLPSNQELLDFLASAFIEDGWSPKAMIRRLVTSRAYRMASIAEPRQLEIDPENVFVWRMSPRRMQAEEVRDSLLWIAGVLETTPPEGSKAARFGEGPAGPRAGAFFAETDETHRSMYLTILRSQLPESLALFDFAEPSLVTGERASTNVPAQALFLLNNPFVLRAADLVGQRVQRAGKTDEQRIRRAYTLTYSRPPTTTEVAAAQKFLSEFRVQMRSHSADPIRAAWSAFCQALLSSGEFLYVR